MSDDKICLFCKEKIKGEYMEANGKVFHPDHFNCESCKKSLIGIPFVDVEGFYCQECHAKKQGKYCFSCKELILDKALIAKGKNFHPEHFKCIICDQFLDGVPFLFKDEKFYCEKDYKESFCPKCAACKGIITDQVLKAMDQQYHLDCFKCTECKKSLKTVAHFHHVEGKPYCEEDYIKLFATMCIKCNKVINGKYLKARDQSYHYDCFTCTIDNHPIGEGVYHYEDQKFFCANHYQDKFLHRCKVCSKVILSKYVKFENSYLHPKCWNCAKCNINLYGKPFDISSEIKKFFCKDCFNKQEGNKKNVNVTLKTDTNYPLKVTQANNMNIKNDKTKPLNVSFTKENEKNASKSIQNNKKPSFYRKKSTDFILAEPKSDFLTGAPDGTEAPTRLGRCSYCRRVTLLFDSWQLKDGRKVHVSCYKGLKNKDDNALGDQIVNTSAGVVIIRTSEVSESKNPQSTPASKKIGNTFTTDHIQTSQQWKYENFVSDLPDPSKLEKKTKQRAKLTSLLPEEKPNFDQMKDCPWLNPKYMEPFRKFLVMQLNDEILLFSRITKEYKKLCSEVKDGKKDRKKAIHLLRAIYNTHIAEGSPQEINISGTLRDILRTNYKRFRNNNEVLPNFFDGAIIESEKILFQSFLMFKRTKLFNRLDERRGSL